MPILSQNSLEFTSRSVDQTRRLGMRLGGLLRVGDVIALTGDLGSGKTTFVQGVAQGWGSTDTVSSPTFVLVNQYRRPDGSKLHHMDAYRLGSALEAEDLDIDAMLESGTLVIEWAERISEVLPADRLTLEMTWFGDELRNMIFIPHGKRYQDLMIEFRHQAFGG